MKITSKFTVNMKLSDVFSYIAKDFFENHQKWDPDLLENTKLTKGPIRVGTKGRAVTKFAGKQVAYFEVTEYEPDKRFSFVNTSGPVSLERSYHFKPVPRGTEITFVFDMRPGSLSTRLAFPILQYVTKKRVHQNIRTLETLLSR